MMMMMMTYSEQTDELVEMRLVGSVSRTPAHARIPPTINQSINQFI